MTLYYWQQSSANTGGRWIPVASGLDSLSGGIEAPAVKQYPLITYNDEPRKIMALYVSWTGNGAEPGGASLLAGGAAVVMGTTILDVGDTLVLNVTTAGKGTLGFTVHFQSAAFDLAMEE
jgi:hypothetical protein